MIPETLAGLAVAVDTLVPYGANPRRGDVSKIAESLSVNGQYRPIVVREQTREVLAGNHTLAAAKSLGWGEIAATFVSCDDEQAKRIVLVDNRSNDVAGYDNAELLGLLTSLEEGLEGTGFDADSLAELERMVREAEVPPEPLTDPDYVPPSPRVPVSEPGDVWELGVHRLVVGDGTDPEVVAKATGGGLADAYVSDPPYNVAYQGGTADALQIENDDMGADEFRSFLGALFCAAYAHTRAGAPGLHLPRGHRGHSVPAIADRRRLAVEAGSGVGEELARFGAAGPPLAARADPVRVEARCWAFVVRRAEADDRHRRSAGPGPVVA